MLRVVVACTLIGTIYSYSPHRPHTGFRDSLAAAATGVSAQLATSVAASGLGSVLADAALRRTFADTVPAGAPGQSEAAGRGPARADAQPGRPEGTGDGGRPVRR